MTRAKLEQNDESVLLITHPAWGEHGIMIDHESGEIVVVDGGDFGHPVIATRPHIAGGTIISITPDEGLYGDR